MRADGAPIHRIERWPAMAANQKIKKIKKNSFSLANGEAGEGNGRTNCIAAYARLPGGSEQ
jgi:hypothetical protein